MSSSSHKLRGQDWDMEIKKTMEATKSQEQ